MRILNLVQGSAQWLAHRRTKFNASDAPAMLGESPHCTRAELLHRMATGIAPEVDAATQRRFDAGHQVEALLGKHAEKIIGEPLHPFVGVADFDERLSASFDGCTFVGDEVDECKLLNARLRAAFADMETIAPEHRERSAAQCLPIDYRIQMEQQLRVAEADRCLFLTGELRSDGTLGDVFSCWYYPDDALWARIRGGWAQFAEDLKTFVAGEPVAPAPVGRAPEHLPALRIEVTGKVTASNLDAFKAHALAVFKGINRALTTDADFADAEKTVKWCVEVEDRLKAAKQHALSQTESIDALFNTIDAIGAEARDVRLELDKLVKAEKERRRGEIVATGVTALREHVAALEQRLGRRGLMPTIPADFGGAIKGKKSLSSMEDAIDVELARAKIAANEVADRIQVNLAHLAENAEHAHLWPDSAAIVQKAPDDLQALVASRIAVHRAAEEKRLNAERDRIRAKEQAKAERDARQKMEREERERAEQRRRDEENAAAAAATQALAESRRAEALPEQLQKALEDMSGALITDLTINRVADSAKPAANTPAVVPIRAETPATPPSLRLGQINERIAPLSIDAAGLARLGFPHLATDKSAKLFNEADFPRMVDSMVAHLRMAQAQRQEAA